MKKNSVVLLVACAMLISGCGATGQVNEAATENTEEVVAEISQEDKVADETVTELSVDEQFFSDLREGLYKRWDNVLNPPEFENSVDQNEWYMENVTKAELDAIEKYKNESFEDDDLAYLVKKYIEALNNQYEYEKYNGADNEKYQEFYIVKGANVRGDVLETFVNDYGFTVDSDKQDNLNMVIYNEEISKIDAELPPMSADVNNDELTFTTQEVENTSDFDLKNATATIYFIDESGNAIFNASSKKVPSWKKGEKVTFTFDDKIPEDVNGRISWVEGWFDYEVDFSNMQK